MRGFTDRIFRFFGNLIQIRFAENSFVEKELPSENTEERVKIGFVPEERSARLLIDINVFVLALRAFHDAIDASVRRNEIKRILTGIDWIEHHKDKYTGRRVLSESSVIEYDHEKRTAICLTQVNYDVVFAPKGIFRKNDKKFDIYLLRDSVILEADLKCISSKQSFAISNRIIAGSYQAPRVVLDIRSNISSKDLIDGLRSGTGRNNLLKEILLFYNGKFYRLPKTLIWSKKIFNILKSEKGYT